MPHDNSRIANFIIGGTEKAGTTSVFVYLCEHPQVCGSSVKETDFFRREYSGDPRRDILAYGIHFARCEDSKSIVMEASPGYLGEALLVVPRIATLLPDIKLLFILRDPIERLYSSYNFHLAKFNISSNISFNDYVRRCLAYDRGEANAEDLGMEKWYLDVLRFGRYSEYLAHYYSAFPRSNIKVMFFEDLRDDAVGFMKELSVFLGINKDFWDDYEFIRANITFTSKNRFVHKMAMSVNDKAEWFLRQRPQLKRMLVNLYKKFNQAREGYEPMNEQVRNELYLYYRSSNQALCELVRGKVADWCLAKEES